MSNVYFIIGKDLSYPERVFTEFHVNINGYCFPFDDWTDFSYNILATWTFSLLESTYTPREIDLPFFDGSYSIKATVDNKSNIILKGMSGNNVVCECHTTVNEFLKEIRYAFRQLSDIVYSSETYSKCQQCIADIECNTQKIDQALKSK